MRIALVQANPVIRPRPKHDSKPVSKRDPAREDEDQPGDSSDSRRRPLLEVDPSLSRKVDIHNIVAAEGQSKAADRPRAVEEVTPSEGFVDDPDVPPLI